MSSQSLKQLQYEAHNIQWNQIECLLQIIRQEAEQCSKFNEKAPDTCTLIRLDPNLYELQLNHIQQLQLQLQSVQEQVVAVETTVHIRVLQIGAAVSIYLYQFDPSNNQNNSQQFKLSLFATVKLNLTAFFIHQSRNGYTFKAAKSVLQNIMLVCKSGQHFKRMVEIIRVRLLNKIWPPVKRNVSSASIFQNENAMCFIVQFLTIQDFLALTSINSEALAAFGKNNPFWNKLYTFRFAYTGFKSNIVDWKKAYIYKLKSQ